MQALCSMKLSKSAVFKNTEGDYLLAEIELDGKLISVMDEFGGDRLKSGDKLEVELMNSCGDALDWDAVFNANPNKKKGLDHISSWEYFAFGEIISINPMMCDCSIAVLEGPFDTNDERCIGEFIGFRLSRLTAFGT
jgi:hypothetical protein